MTIGELLNKLQAMKSVQDARMLSFELMQDNPEFWWVNVKYVSGYLGNQERSRVLSLFGMIKAS